MLGLALAASLLFAIEVAPTGGRTGFSNMYLAMETLPAALRRKMEGKTMKVDATYFGDGQLRGGYAQISAVRFSEGVSRPIVRTHADSGRNARYLGRRPYAYIKGLTVAESESLLDELREHAGQPAFCWPHAWRPADILVWDNRCTMHRRDPIDPHARRVTYDANIMGSRPGNDPAAGGCSPQPRGYQRHSGQRA